MVKVLTTLLVDSGMIGWLPFMGYWPAGGPEVFDPSTEVGGAVEVVLRDAASGSDAFERN